MSTISKIDTFLTEKVTAFFEKKGVQKTFWPLWVIAIFSLTVSLLFDFGIRFNTTPSLPVGIYQEVGGKVAKGDMASFCLDSDFAALARERVYLKAGICPSGVQPLLKIVAGLPGDFITQDASQGIFINNQLWPHSVAKFVDSSGRAIAALKLPPIIPEGQALMLSDQHDGSFDSRYFGLVPMNTLKKVHPLLTTSKGEYHGK